jgi:hypothetical protein
MAWGVDIVDAEHAPIIYFDGIETWATTASDIGHLTLTAARHVASGSSTKTVSMTAAHLRFPLDLLPILKAAIEKMELAAAKPTGGKPS